MLKDSILNKEPLAIVIFGATGDLYKNKLSIALFDLFYAGLLPKEFRVLAFARRDFSSSGFQTLTKEFILKKHLNKAHRNTKEKLNFENKLESFLKKIYYIKGDFTKLDDFAFLAACSFQFAPELSAP
jgi:glucose-6-phosphate 1-dehydrogenase